jgi:hypothetical protein
MVHDSTVSPSREAPTQAGEVPRPLFVLAELFGDEFDREDA